MKIALKIVLSSLLGGVIMFAGCSLPQSYRSADQAVLKDAGYSGKYAWRLGIADVHNNTEYQGWDLEKTLYLNMTRTIRKNFGSAILVGYDAPDAPDVLNALPLSADGQLDNFALTSAARNSSMNAVLISIITGIRVDEELKGFLRFKTAKYYLRIQVLTDLYDTTTGAKFSSETSTTDLEVDESDAKAITAMSETAVPLLSESITPLAVRAGESICAALHAAQWRASVLEENRGVLTISAGGDAGIKPEDRLLAYEGRRVMNGADGKRFVIPGYEIGEIEIISVSPHRAEAKIISSDPVPTGSIVVPRGFSLKE